MDKTVPDPAALLLDFIGETEAPRGYDTIYGNNQRNLPQRLTSMTVDEVLAAQPRWSRQYGSSAGGRYQFMHATLKELKKELGLRGSQVFDADLQDRLAYHLLLRRGYSSFIKGNMSLLEFGKRLAMEWASFPVLSNTKGAHRNVVRGQSYYAGDGLNKALVKPEKVEEKLRAALLLPPHTRPLPDVKENENMPTPSVVTVETKPATHSKINWLALATAATALATRFGFEIDAQTLADLLTGIAVVGPVLIAAVRTFWSRTVLKSSV